MYILLVCYLTCFVDCSIPIPRPLTPSFACSPNNGMTPHYSGTTLDAQARYADGTKKILDAWFKGEAFEDSWYIVREGGPRLPLPSRLQVAMWLSPAALFRHGLCSPVQVSWLRSTSRAYLSQMPLHTSIPRETQS